MSATTGKCVTNCGAGYYGLTSYTKRGNIKESKCTACSSSCYECIGGSASQCISCPSGKYLSKASTSVSYGSCLAKAGTPSGPLTVYVTNPEGNYASNV